MREKMKLRRAKATRTISANVPAEGVAGGYGVPGVIADVATFAHGELLKLGGEGDGLGEDNGRFGWKVAACEIQKMHLCKDGKHGDIL